MTRAWETDVDISGRIVSSCELVGGGRAPSPGRCALLFVLAGRVEVGGRALTSGDVGVLCGETLIAGRQGASLTAVAWDEPQPPAVWRVEETVSRRFEQYDSFQARIRVSDGARDAFAPWELYRVRMVGERTERVRLHVHREVSNVVFVPGEVGVPRGYLLVEHDGRVTATSIVGGDRVVVRPGVRHHIVPVVTTEPVDMIVCNDGEAGYEDVATSDFHHAGIVAWDDVELVERAGVEPRLTLVEPVALV